MGLIIALMLIDSGCSVAVRDYTSNPVSRIVETQIFKAGFTPGRKGANYFSFFRLDIENKSDAVIQIDWNKTRYIHEGKNRGKFVFEGIDPSLVREKSIPKDKISPEKRFSRQIFPLAKIAIAQGKDYSAGREKPGLYGGKLPPGENSILLVIQSKGKLIRKKISVVITEQAE